VFPPYPWARYAAPDPWGTLVAASPPASPLYYDSSFNENLSSGGQIAPRCFLKKKKTLMAEARTWVGAGRRRVLALVDRPREPD
jgi:hypothetical protein